MARVSLIWPNDSECYKFDRSRTKRFPLGLGYISAVLEKAGHDVRVVDGSLYELPVEEIVDNALSHDPEFVGIGFSTPLYHQAVAVVSEIKARSPSCVVVAGGPHVTALPEATLETSLIDIVVLNEGEPIIASVVDGLPLETIPSIAFRANGEVRVTRRFRYHRNEPQDKANCAPDLDSYPLPARHLFDWWGYVDYARGVRESQTGIIFSRGCPGKCVFCGAANTLVRFRSLEKVLDELCLIEEMGITNVFVMDDTFTSGKKRLLNWAKGIKDRAIRLTFSVQLRLDQLDQEICDAMYESGVRYVGPGVESGNEQIMKLIGKGPKESKEHIRQKITLLKSYEWTVRCSYVMGMINETEEQIMDTIYFAKELDADENAFSLLVPYPDSPLWQLAKSMGKVHDKMDFRRFLYYGDIGCNLSAVPTERLLGLHRLAYEMVGNKSYHLREELL